MIYHDISKSTACADQVRVLKTPLGNALLVTLAVLLFWFVERSAHISNMLGGCGWQWPQELSHIGRLRCGAGRAALLVLCYNFLEYNLQHAKNND